jgi:hypothetical protein
MKQVDIEDNLRYGFSRRNYTWDNRSLLTYSLGGMAEIIRPGMHKDKLQLVDLLYTLFTDLHQNPDRESIL